MISMFLLCCKALYTVLFYFLQVCTLARERTSTMIALYSGTVSASGVIFIFIKVLVNFITLFIL